MAIGDTNPKLAVLDDGTHVVIKLINGPEGNLVLFNEHVCYKLAKLVALPMPTSGVCLVDNDTEFAENDLASEENYGPAFYSTYVSRATRLVPNMVNTLQNKNVFPKLLLFDHIIFNKDRNEGNLLLNYFNGNSLKIIVIDHTHVFINQAIWDAQCLLQAMNAQDIPDTRVLEYNNSIYDMFFRKVSITNDVLAETSMIFKEKYSHDTICQIVESSPSRWQPPREDMNALIQYLDYRVANIDGICGTIINYLSKKEVWEND